MQCRPHHPLSPGWPPLHNMTQTHWPNFHYCVKPNTPLPPHTLAIELSVLSFWVKLFFDWLEFSILITCYWCYKFITIILVHVNICMENWKSHSHFYTENSLLAFSMYNAMNNCYNVCHWESLWVKLKTEWVS